MRDKRASYIEHKGKYLIVKQIGGSVLKNNKEEFEKYVEDNNLELC